MYRVIKTYGNDRGLSCCFRQWRASSHCAQLHGYSIGVELTFACETLDSRNWVIDFGDLGKVKDYLEQTFDHTVLIANDDPQRALLETVLSVRGSEDSGRKLGKVKVVDAVGCEAFAKMIHQKVNLLLIDHNAQARGLKLESVKVFEHGANAASYSE